jgi:alpha-1,3/alpha-1,6-mannosyltransferase|eukprot:g2127.t1
MSSGGKTKPLKIAFLHPDLGLGGAERLIVDCAVGLKDHDHDITMYTSHYEEQRSFSETRQGLFSIEVYGDYIPRHICQGFHIFFAMFRNIWLATRVGLSCKKYDVFIVDQVSISVPFLRFFSPSTKVLFYCHFPDQLLSPRTSLLKSLYRYPFDRVEEFTTGMSDLVVVNSKFTKNVYKKTFTRLTDVPGVLYPCVPLTPVEDLPQGRSKAWGKDDVVFLSINRFERKKAIHLAVKALIELRDNILGEAKFKKHKIRLVVAGGYDTRVKENVDHFTELQNIAKEGNVFDCITWKRAFSDEEKSTLLGDATAVVYTPTNEHFGIVPVECMAACKPVIACASGGPLESVESGVTGFLCEPTAESFARAMLRLIEDPAKAKKMGLAGRKRVEAMFSRQSLGDKLDKLCSSLIENPPRRSLLSVRAFVAQMCFLAFALYIALSVRKPTLSQ